MRRDPDAHAGGQAAHYRLGLLLVAGSAVAWSLAGLFTRLIHLDTWTLLAWRGIFGAVGIAVVDVAMHGRRIRRSLGGLGWAGWVYAAVGAVAMVAYISALRATSVAHVAVIYATVPFFAAVGGWLALHETPSRSAVASSLFALIGVAVMVGLDGRGGLFGDALAVCMTAMVAAVMVIARRFRAMPVMTASALSALLSGLVCLPFALPVALVGPELPLLALFGLVNSAAGLALFTLGAQLLPTMETALIGALDAPLAPLWVWLAFGESPSPSTIAGGFLVFVAVGTHLGRAARRRS